MPDYATLPTKELSAEVAQRLFGWRLETPRVTSGHPRWTNGEYWFCALPDCTGGNFPRYASDHNAAMGLVVPEMRKRGYEFFMEDDMENGTVTVFFTHWTTRSTVPFGEEPRAICLAALAALDAEEGKE